MGIKGKKQGWGTEGNEERGELESNKAERRGEWDGVSVRYDMPLPKQELIQ